MFLIYLVSNDEETSNFEHLGVGPNSKYGKGYTSRCVSIHT